MGGKPSRVNRCVDNGSIMGQPLFPGFLCSYQSCRHFGGFEGEFCTDRMLLRFREDWVS